jgi:hypothetical protein
MYTPIDNYICCPMSTFVSFPLGPMYHFYVHNLPNYLPRAAGKCGKCEPPVVLVEALRMLSRRHHVIRKAMHEDVFCSGLLASLSRYVR